MARSNVCPKIDPPSEPSFYAFSYMIPLNDAPTSFVIAGSAEVPEGKPDYRGHLGPVRIVAPFAGRGSKRLNGTGRKPSLTLARLVPGLCFQPA